MKCHHPDIFCAALLNAQPMGFYAPAQLVRDAQRAWRRGAAGLRQRQPLGLHAGGERGGRLSAPPPRPAHGEGPLQRAWRADRRGGDGRALRLDRGCLAPLGRAGGGAGEAGRCRRLPLRSASTGARRCGGCAGSAAAPLPLFAAAEARGAGARGGADAADRRAARWSRIIAPSSSRCAPIRSPSCGRSSTGAASSRCARSRTRQGRQQGPGRRHRPGPPAAGQGQRHLHHPRGRDRHRQRSSSGSASSRRTAGSSSPRR